jgi:hypothetical protein
MRLSISQRELTEGRTLFNLTNIACGIHPPDNYNPLPLSAPCSGQPTTAFSILKHPSPGSSRAKSVVDSIVVLSPSLTKKVAKWDEASGGVVHQFGTLVGLGRLEFHATYARETEVTINRSIRRG